MGLQATRARKSPRGARRRILPALLLSLSLALSLAVAVALSPASPAMSHGPGPAISHWPCSSASPKWHADEVKPQYFRYLPQSHPKSAAAYQRRDGPSSRDGPVSCSAPSLHGQASACSAQASSPGQGPHPAPVLPGESRSPPMSPPLGPRGRTKISSLLATADLVKGLRPPTLLGSSALSSTSTSIGGSLSEQQSANPFRDRFRAPRPAGACAQWPWGT